MTTPSSRYTPEVPQLDYEGVDWFTNSYNVTPTTTGAWVGVDVSAYVPINMSGVILDIHNTKTDTSRSVDVRHPDSTDDFYAQGQLAWKSQRGTVPVGINSTRHFEAKIEHADIRIWLMGYTDETVTYFTNVINENKWSVC